MSHKSAIKALEMAIKDIDDPTGIIHHSDRGCQYCCHDYIKVLHDYKMLSSMTDKDHCAQNALAERMNGILKDEFFLDIGFNSFDDALKAVNSAVYLYNNKRPHLSLFMKTPEEFFRLAA